MRREYKYPPVEELVIGVYFSKPLLSLRSEHVGVFWSRVKKEFPKIEQQPPIKAFIGAPDEQFPMPRFWLRSEEDHYLIQVQRNAFLVNWRKQGDGNYPHFDTVKAAFDRHYSAFSQFMSEELGTDLVIELCELSYTNIVALPSVQGDDMSVPEIIPSFRSLRPGVVSAALREAATTNTFEVAEDMTLIVSLRTGRRAADDKGPVLIFEQRVTGRVKAGTRSEADAWFARAHDVTGACFNGLTSSKFQNEFWQPKEQA